MEATDLPPSGLTISTMGAEGAQAPTAEPTPTVNLPPTTLVLDSVTTLDLSYNHLSSLPPQIARLSSLLRLDLSNNRIGFRNAKLPPAMASLAHLTRLDLSWNKIKVLPDVIGKLPTLTYLNLADNNLTGLPKSLAGLAPSLRTLNVDGNEEIGPDFPNVITSLVALRELYMDATSVQRIPPALGGLTALNSITLADNGLASNSCASALSSLTSLSNLVLDENNFTSVPGFVAKLPALKWLSLRGNPLSNIKSLAKVKTLVELDVQDTDVESLPAGLAKIPSLTYIGADNTEIESLPASLEAAMNQGRIAIGLPYHLRPTEPPAPSDPLFRGPTDLSPTSNHSPTINSGPRTFRLRSATRIPNHRKAPLPTPLPPPPSSSTTSTASPPTLSERTISFAEPSEIEAVRLFDVTETPSMLNKSHPRQFLSPDSDTSLDSPTRFN